MGKPLVNGRIAFVVLSICTASLGAGCSGIKTYTNTLEKNLHVQTATDSGSWFSHVRVAVDIHRVGKDCATDYEGTVQLTEPTMEIGIPPDRWSRLVFVFASSSFWGNRSSTITYETLLRPRPTYHYDVAVSYRNDLYHVAIRETPSNRSPGRELDRLTLSACRSPSTQK
jgi:hypothetical protein